MSDKKQRAATQAALNKTEGQVEAEKAAAAAKAAEDAAKAAEEAAKREPSSEEKDLAENDELYAKALAEKNGYMRDSGAVINKKTVNSLVDDLETAVTETGKVNADLHRNTLSVLKDLKALRNKPLGLEEADQYRQLLNDVVSSGTDGTGKINPDAMKALSLIDVLDSRIERLGNGNMVGGGSGAAQLLKQARQEWGRYRRFDKVAALIERYGDSPGVLKNQVRLLLQNKKATRGFNEQELAALKKLSQKGGVEGWLRFAGRAGIDLKNPSGNILPILIGGGATAAADVSTLGVLSGLRKPLYVLEDAWKGNARGVSCIPAGTYDVVPHGWEASTRVKFKQTWRLQNVPGRTAILIHAGNTHADTEGCLLVGMGMQVSQLASIVTDSRMAVDYLRKQIGQAEFTIEIVDEVNPI